MNQKKIKLLSVGKANNEILFFQQWFAEAWVACGGELLENKKWPHILSVVFGRNWPSFHFRRKDRLIVLGCGRIESAAWPNLLTSEIIPMMWDLWPDKIAPFCRFVRRHNIKTILCAASYTAIQLRELLPKVDIFWIPEGINVDAYPMGGLLKDRPIDMLSYGRQMNIVVDKLRILANDEKYDILFREGDAHLFVTFNDLVKGLQSSKITICYPQSVTHPERAQDIETLTQRYWEAMLTGTLLVGHAPKELIEVCGYNPVIELGDNPVTIVRDVLMHIKDYQELADKNRNCAEEKAGWDKRMPKIMEILK